MLELRPRGGVLLAPGNYNIIGRTCYLAPPLLQELLWPLMGRIADEIEGGWERNAERRGDFILQKETKDINSWLARLS
jgi:hypothetical protein